MFLVLPDPDSDPLVRSIDPDPSIIKQKQEEKNLDSYCIVTFLGLFIFENDVNIPSKSNKQKKCIKKISFLLAS
jgi:hypothetical protein